MRRSVWTAIATGLMGLTVSGIAYADDDDPVVLPNGVIQSSDGSFTGIVRPRSPSTDNVAAAAAARQAEMDRRARSAAYQRENELKRLQEAQRQREQQDRERRERDRVERERRARAQSAPQPRPAAPPRPGYAPQPVSLPRPGYAPRPAAPPRPGYPPPMVNRVPPPMIASNGAGNMVTRIGQALNDLGDIKSDADKIRAASDLLRQLDFLRQDAENKMAGMDRNLAELERLSRLPGGLTPDQARMRVEIRRHQYELMMQREQIIPILKHYLGVMAN